jgi:hypothetical protein
MYQLGHRCESDIQNLFLHCLVEFTYLLNASNALRGAIGILQFGVALFIGQTSVVSTRTLKSTPCRLVWKYKWHILNKEGLILCHSGSYDISAFNRKQEKIKVKFQLPYFITLSYTVIISHEENTTLLQIRIFQVRVKTKHGSHWELYN